MKLETLRDLLIEELQDLYDVEHQLVEALPKLKSAAHSRELKQAIDMHLDETRQHVTRLERSFELMGQPAKRKACKGMKGIIKEGDELLEEKGVDKDVLDAGIIKSAQAAEHYEIAGYGTAMAYAKQVGENELINLLGQTLTEEKMADEKLTQLAESSINVKAAQ
jgi:ferritin-like metal-binding protein YciE